VYGYLFIAVVMRVRRVVALRKNRA